MELIQVKEKLSVNQEVKSVLIDFQNGISLDFITTKQEFE